MFSLHTSVLPETKKRKQVTGYCPASPTRASRHSFNLRSTLPATNKPESAGLSFVPVFVRQCFPAAGRWEF